MIIVLAAILAGCASAPKNATSSWREKKTQPPKLVPNSSEASATIRTVIREAAGTLTRADLKKVERLDLKDNQITDLTPLAKLTGLKELNLLDNKITDLTPLTRMNKLEWLYLGNNQITDLTPLERLTNLTILGLNNNKITDLTPLERLANLTNLGLSFNEIHDLTPLRGLKKLKVLHLIDKRFYLPDNPSRTFAEIDKLRQTLPNCVIHHNARK